MSIQAPQGILNIPNATLRVGKLAVDSTAGFDTVFNNVERNTILLVDSTEYPANKQWDLKMPNIFVATFEIKGTGSSFNFRNTSNGDATVGYTLTFSGTGLTLKYGNGDLATAIIPDLDATYGKVYLTYEKQYFTVTVDGTRVLAYKDDVTRTPPDGEYINFFAGTGTPGFQKLKVVAGHLISDGTSNVSLYGGLAVTSNLEVGQANLFVDTTTSRVGVGTTEPDASLHVTGNAYITSNLEVGQANLFVDTTTSRVGVGTTEPKEALDVVGNMHLTRVSNVSQIKVDSNVVTEYTGPHDRPLREYPEIIMTAATTGGYTVSASSNLTDKNPWEAFNPNDYWRSLNGYSTSDPYGYTGGEDVTDTNGTLHEGEWLKLELPNKINISRVTFAFHSSGSFQPTSYVILGSNNDTSWTLIHTNENLSPGRSPLYLSEDNFTTVGYFKYLKLLVKNVIDATPSVLISRLRYYGYEEGSGSLDTTLKSVYNVPATTGTQLEVYYDGQDYTADTDFDQANEVLDKSGNNLHGSQTGGVGFDSTWKAFSFDGTGDYITNTRSGYSSSGTYTVSTWVNISKEASGQTNPNIFQYGIGQTSTTDTGIGLITNSSDDRIQAFVYGNNDFVVYGIKKYGTWIHLTSIYELSASGTNITLYVNGNNVGSQATSTAAGIGATPHLSIGVQANSSDLPIPSTYFNGSIANFRLYSKALNADQVKELYDYQKDYFLGSKSQVTLYKGHLGVGVTEPSGQLELAGDERIQEYPPRGMTNPSTYIEGHGVFKAYGFQPQSDYPAWQAFDHTGNLSSVWYSDNLSEFTGTGEYNGSARLAPETVKGPYIVLEMPYEIVLKQIKFWQQFGGSHVWDRGVYYAKCNPSDEWTAIHNVTDRPANDTTPYVAYITDPRPYKYFAVVITRRYAATATSGVSIRDLQFFGTPGPTTLDKGSLSLGRSLDVPRVSRYDVDTETPRPEKLLVDFDTTVNISPTDISGKGNHGTMVGATYSPADKAFNFDGTDDLIKSTIEVTANFAHSVSVWIKVDTVGENTFFSLGNETTVGTDLTLKSSTVYTTGSGFTFTFYGGDMTIPFSYSTDRWYHIVATRDTGGTFPNTQKFYIDGVDYSASASWNNSTSTTLALPTTATLLIGKILWATSARFDGQISNFKLYNVALEPSEVKKLYNLGRTGRSMVISDTAVGIGKVPEAQLDVRGTANFGSRVGIGTTNPSAQLHISSGNSGDCVLKIEADEDNNNELDNPRIEFITDGGYNTALVGAGQMPFETSNDNALVLAGRQMKFYTGSVQDFTDPTSMTERIRILSGGNVGIGTTNPACALHIVHGIDGGGTKDLDSQFNCAITSQRDDGTNRWMHGINGTDDYLFWYDANGSGIATCKAFFDHDGSDSVDQNFTGQHRTFIKDTPFVRAVELEGLIVSADNNKYIKMTGGIEVGSNAITTNESLPLVSLSTTTNDKKCFGVISASEDPETRENRFGNIVSVSQKELGDTRVYINSVGEGAMWVVNTAGPLESGDYITTSNVVGYGQKQDIEFLANYTVAKITMDCDFEPATQPIQIIKKELANVNYWVKTTYENVTEEEYSNLTEENRQIVDGVYQKITKEESKTEQEGYELEVRQELVNVLDEHGQIQWEDDPSGATEKAYKIRYLDANGNITDEANHVYKAAFVGCTYHCG